MTYDEALAWWHTRANYERTKPPPGGLKLDRMRDLLRRLGDPHDRLRTVHVAGSKGKGSTCAMLAAMLRAAGYRAGLYTSPHLLRYNERVRIDGRTAADAELVAAFERVEAARGGTSLTYFEFGTLAAALLFREAGLDAAILEVGLGGRLDAVNLFDPDCAVVTSIGLDHMDYLGPTRESIGLEKAGIFRTDRPAVVGEAEAFRSLDDDQGCVGNIDADLDHRRRDQHAKLARSE